MRYQIGCEKDSKKLEGSLSFEKKNGLTYGLSLTLIKLCKGIQNKLSKIASNFIINLFRQLMSLAFEVLLV